MSKQISKKSTSELIIKKSKFISFLYPINSENNVKDILNKLKKEFKDSSHICYSYILDENTFKYYDDGEPSCSAGLPIYQVLKGNKLVYTLAVVIRYFGGTKLGVGGLIKAYTNAVTDALSLNTLIEYEKSEIYIIKLNYNSFTLFENFCITHEIKIINKQFEEKVIVTINTSEEKLALIKQEFITD